MFFKKNKKHYTIKPNFSGPAEDFDLMRTGIVSRITNDDDAKKSFVAGVICHWVYDEKSQKFLSQRDGMKWLVERIKSGEGEALAIEIGKAIEETVEIGKEREIERLFGLR